MHASLEAVLEAARDAGEVLHAAGADGLSALGLLAPVVCVASFVSKTSRRVTTPDPVQSFSQRAVMSGAGQDRAVNVHFRVLAAG